jgi:hypothetical protein
MLFELCYNNCTELFVCEAIALNREISDQPNKENKASTYTMTPQSTHQDFEMLCLLRAISDDKISGYSSDEGSPADDDYIKLDLPGIQEIGDSDNKDYNVTHGNKIGWKHCQSF